MMISTIKIEDIDSLDRVFATLTSTGWVIPTWLVKLRDYVVARDSEAPNADGH